VGVVGVAGAGVGVGGASGDARRHYEEKYGKIKGWTRRRINKRSERERTRSVGRVEEERKSWFGVKVRGERAQWR
jgi:hypothetical protein